MFESWGRRPAGRQASGGRRRGRMPITIGIEQLEGREMLSSIMATPIIPAGLPPLRSMPRPIVGRLDPEATGEAGPSPRPRPATDRRRTPSWAFGGRFRMG